MKKIKIYGILNALALFLISGILCCCTDEREQYVSPGGSGREKTVTFSVKVPGTGTPKTYALNEADENHIKQIAVLLFDASGNYVHYPVYSNSISTDQDDITKKTFTVKIPEGTYDMVVLANANANLSAVLSSINTGDAKAQVLKKLLLVNPDKWDTDASSESYIPIPMYGQIKDITIGTGSSGSIPVKLARMVAKIDVILSDAAQSDFDLKSVRLYNYNDRGQVVPDAANWNNDADFVTAPSVPSSAKKLGNPTTSSATEALLYNVKAITKDGVTRGISCLNEIYAFEAAAGSKEDYLGNTCLVVGGHYKGDANETYYRIDLANTKDGVTAYLPLLRNHQYRVNINQISGPGLGSYQDAFKSHPVNIKAGIIRWSDGRFSDFAVNDQYLLGVSQAQFTFSREEHDNDSDDNILSVVTDYPGGWKIDRIEQGSTSWLTCSIEQDSGSFPKGDDIRLHFGPNDGAEARTALIHIKAERLVYIVKVTQEVTVDMDISIINISGKEVNMIEFVSTKQEVINNIQPPGQVFRVKWAPAASTLFFNSNALGSNPFSFDSSPGQNVIPDNGSLEASSGTKVYAIRPALITEATLNADPFYERSSIILYKVSDGGVSTFTKTLTLLQYVYNMKPEVKDVYTMDGEKKSFMVRSNSPFTVTVKTDPHNIISGLTTTGLANTNGGTPVNFNIIDDMANPVLYQKDVIVTVKSPKNYFPDTDVTLSCASGDIQPESNSYIVAPDDLPILIPVSRANQSKLGIQLNDDDAFTAELLWTDNVNRIASNSNIRMIKSIGRGADGYVLVMPGNAEGNAVVCIKNLSGNILWSWHIWVTGYMPAPIGAGKFMDRHLGALGNSPGKVKTKGLLYQWGRKDPFPGSTTVEGNIDPRIYKNDGTHFTFDNNDRRRPAKSDNFAESVQHPDIFYYGPDNSNYDWHGTTVQDDNLWGHNTAKTVYDPCPEGWRVPQGGVWNGMKLGDFKWGNYGRTYDYYGGFYPAAGQRAPGGGRIINTGERGFVWMASPGGDGKQAAALYFESPSTNTYYYTSWGMYRAGGLSVRCVKE